MSKLTEHELRRRLTALPVHTKRQSPSLNGYRPAGVLVPVVFSRRTPELLFTKRTELVETHKGQISFPGGMADPDDKTIIQTALRETSEEVGIPEHAVEVVGMLEDLFTPTGFVITPVLGIIDKLPDIHINAMEVEEVFTLPLSFFANPATGRMEMRSLNGKNHEVWFYETGKHTIWGVTANIIRSLLTALQAV